MQLTSALPSLELLRSFYSEGLVDNRTFLSWLVQQIATSNLAQLGFVACLANEYLDGMLECRALTHSFVQYSLTRLSEVSPRLNMVNTAERAWTLPLDIRSDHECKRITYEPRASAENIDLGKLITSLMLV